MVLDTNAYSALQSGDASIQNLIQHAKGIALPFPVIAELRYGFARGSREAENEAMLTRFLSQRSVTVLTPTINTTKVYAKLAVHCQRAGRALSHNDLWIAALSEEYGEQLVTFDKDFAVFSSLLGDKLVILDHEA